MRKNEMEIALEIVERTFALLYADPQKGDRRAPRGRVN